MPISRKNSNSTAAGFHFFDYPSAMFRNDLANRQRDSIPRASKAAIPAELQRLVNAPMPQRRGPHGGRHGDGIKRSTQEELNKRLGYPKHVRGTRTGHEYNTDLRSPTAAFKGGSQRETPGPIMKGYDPNKWYGTPTAKQWQWDPSEATGKRVK